jgi:hypothetical protein
VVITSASHAEGREFEPRLNLIFCDYDFSRFSFSSSIFPTKKAAEHNAADVAFEAVHTKLELPKVNSESEEDEKMVRV